MPTVRRSTCWPVLAHPPRRLRRAGPFRRDALCGHDRQARSPPSTTPAYSTPLPGPPPERPRLAKRHDRATHPVSGRRIQGVLEIFGDAERYRVRLCAKAAGPSERAGAYGGQRTVRSSIHLENLLYRLRGSNGPGSTSESQIMIRRSPGPKCGRARHGAPTSDLRSYEVEATIPRLGCSDHRRDRAAM